MMKCRIKYELVVALCAAGGASTSSACALTSKAELVEIRYFSPERIHARTQSTKRTLEPPPEVRLGRVSSGPNLRERIAYRDAAYERGYYEELRWTERPETYVRRELGRSLFEAHGLRRVVSGPAPTLDVEVVAFDDLRLATGRAARIQLNVLLYSDDGVLFEDTLTTECPVAVENPRIENLIAAMASALESTADQVTVKVQDALTSTRRASSTAQTP
jgi:cholesterol transport system auxiliary component